MKTRTIVYPVVILLALVVPVARYYASTPDINACMQVYIDNLSYAQGQGYIYRLEGDVRHIEPANSKNVKALEPYIIGKANGCLMYSDDLIGDLNNTVYCAITYMIKNAPIKKEMKEPLALYQRP